jgi:SAM-dependent methyltransferase
VPYYRPVISPIIRFFRRRWLPVAYRGSGVICPICEADFRGYVGSPLGSCPGCGAPERARLLWFFLQHQRPELLTNTPTILQIAPDTGLESKLRLMKGIRYLSGDLQEPEAMIKLDLTKLDLPDKCFDLIICLHVLAHISDDRRAMREILRVLRPGGIALLMTPMNTGAQDTYEDPSIIDPDQRDKAYGEWDFVRVYGLDFSDRLKEAGFQIEVVQPADQMAEPDRKAMGLWNDRIFICRRPEAGENGVRGK